jgi:hypothetical protein
MHTAFPARFPFEMLDSIGNENLVARDAGLTQCIIEQPTGRADERLAFAILAIAGLLTDHHDARMQRPCAGHALCGALP